VCRVRNVCRVMMSIKYIIYIVDLEYILVT
jgi:hypothetical protein